MNTTTYALIDRYTGEVKSQGYATRAAAENARKGFRCYVAMSHKGGWVACV